MNEYEPMPFLAVVALGMLYSVAFCWLPLAMFIWWLIVR